MKIEEISLQKARMIIDVRKPLGLFYFKEGDMWLSIDNTTGDAYVEEFENRNDCLSWLIHGPDEEQEYNIQEQQKEIFFHYGLDRQLDQLTEENAELIQAVCKYKRNFRNLKSSRILGSLIEEMADVENMIEQIKLSDNYVARQVNTIKELKIKRQVKRIEKEVQHDKTS